MCSRTGANREEEEEEEEELLAGATHADRQQITDHSDHSDTRSGDCLLEAGRICVVV